MMGGMPMCKRKKASAQHKTSENVVCCLLRRETGESFASVARTKDWDLVMETTFLSRELRTKQFEVPGIPRTTYLMDFSPDGTKVASTHGNHCIYITNLRTGKHVRALGEHPRTPWSIAFHPFHSNLLASGCLGGQVRVWLFTDIHNESVVWNVPGETVIASLAFHPLKHQLAIATRNEIHFWDWDEPEPGAVVKMRSETEKVRYVAFDKSGKILITGIGSNNHSCSRLRRRSWTYKIQIWDFSDARQLNLCWNDQAEDNVVAEDCNIHNDASIDITSDGKLLAAFSSIGHIAKNDILRVYSLEREALGRILCSVRVSFGSPVTVSFSPTRKHVLIGMGGGVLPRAVVYRLKDEDWCYGVIRNELEFVRSIKYGIPWIHGVNLNCIRWVPQLGKGILYATSTGQLCILH